MRLSSPPARGDRKGQEVWAVTKEQEVEEREERGETQDGAEVEAGVCAAVDPDAVEWPPASCSWHACA